MKTTNPKAIYDINYAREKLKRIPLDVKKDRYDQIKKSVEQAGESINGYIKKAIEERIERESK